jgi:hypothetical protein
MRPSSRNPAAWSADRASKSFVAERMEDIKTLAQFQDRKDLTLRCDLGIKGIAPGKAGAKDAARSEAIRRWPDKARLFARVKDDGRAEAALIAVAGVIREARNG